MKISVDLAKETGKIKILNAVNNGPIYHRKADQDLDNLVEFREMRSPYVRTHDSSFQYWYGGCHTVDYYALFPNEDADEFDPKSYDFALTDEYLDTIKLAGSEVFFRIGSKIEHWTKKYNIFPPKDNEKFARVCEHFVRHMNEGWGEGGQHFGIKYWEIWNEPNLDLNWQGTLQQYIDMYITVAKHLKKCFPDLKIGGPAFCGYPQEFVRDFLRQVRDAGAPLDFCSWHEYASVTSRFVKKMRDFRADLDAYGFTKTESICDEWNFIYSFSGQKFRDSVDVIRSKKGAAFTAAVLCEAQREPVDMMMYYDARPCIYNGMFDIYLLRPMKTYYVMRAFGDLYYDYPTAVSTEWEEGPIYAVAGKNEKGDFLTLVTYYSDDKADTARTFDLELKGAEGKTVDLYLTDGRRNDKKVQTLTVKGGKITVTMEPNSFLQVKSHV